MAAGFGIQEKATEAGGLGVFRTKYQVWRVPALLPWADETMHYITPIQRAIDEVETKLRAPISIEGVARKAGFSFWHFQRVFAAVAGEPIGSYIRRRRLTEAARELAATRRRILDIALEYQFESHESFTRAFKSIFHVNPAEFRRAKPFIAGFSRLRLTPDSLTRLSRHPAMTFSIVSLPALTLIGPEARFISALSPDANNLKVIPPLWYALTTRKAEIGDTLDGFAYGACRRLDKNLRSREDELVYLAGYRVGPGQEAPPGMSRWSVPSLTYAHFTHRGPVARLSETINHIYGVWLPRSDFQLDHGPEIERYDERFRPGQDSSEMDFLLPVKPRIPQLDSAG